MDWTNAGGERLEPVVRRGEFDLEIHHYYLIEVEQSFLA